MIDFFAIARDVVDFLSEVVELGADAVQFTVDVAFLNGFSSELFDCLRNPLHHLASIDRSKQWHRKAGRGAGLVNPKEELCALLFLER